MVTGNYAQFDERDFLAAGIPPRGLDFLVEDREDSLRFLERKEKDAKKVGRNGGNGNGRYQTRLY